MSRRSMIGSLAFLGLLLAAGTAYGAGSMLFSGKTSQRQPISFAISSHKVTNLDFWIDLRCAHRRLRRFHASHFSAFALTGSSFDQTFKATGGSARVTVRGDIHGDRIAGSVSLTASAQHCSGTAKYVVTRRHRRQPRAAS